MERAKIGKLKERRQRSELYIKRLKGKRYLRKERKRERRKR